MFEKELADYNHALTLLKGIKKKKQAIINEIREKIAYFITIMRRLDITVYDLNGTSESFDRSSYDEPIYKIEIHKEQYKIYPDRIGSTYSLIDLTKFKEKFEVWEKDAKETLQDLIVKATKKILFEVEENYFIFND
jgi:hypothetical protein